MRRARASPNAGLAAALGLLLGVLAGAAQESDTRIIRGQVLNQEGKPVALAIVHLKNATTDEQWSVVTNKEGRYQFNDLKIKHDYEVYAEWRDQKSRTRKISQFDMRPLLRVTLKLKPTEKPKEEKKDEEPEKDKEDEV
ncbi:MAG: carboxypeptidase-like regulatory domain-containing protein [Terriglobia bacterium]